MHVMLADSIDGGIFAFLALLVCAGASVLALTGLALALLRKPLLAFVMVSPAIIAGVAAVIWIGAGFFTGGQRFPNGPLQDYFGPWAFFAGPPLASSCAVLLVLWFRMRRKPPSNSP